MLTLRKLRLVCQSTILNGYRWSSLSCGVWLPALDSFALANVTLPMDHQLLFLVAHVTKADLVLRVQQLVDQVEHDLL